MPAEHYQAVADWEEKEHGAKMDLSWGLFASGVVPAISPLLRLATSPGDEVLLQELVYNMFYSVIEGNGRRVVPSDLVYEGGEYPLTGRTLKTSWPVLLSGR